MLTDYFTEFEDEIKNRKIEITRLIQLYDSIKLKFPDNIDATINMNPIGHTCIRAFINLKRMNKKAYSSQTKTKEALKWLRTMMINDRINRESRTGKICIERFFRENSGDFAWKLDRRRIDNTGEYSEIIFIENAHKGKCKITKKKVTTEIYVTNCK